MDEQLIGEILNKLKNSGGPASENTAQEILLALQEKGGKVKTGLGLFSTSKPKATDRYRMHVRTRMRNTRSSKTKKRNSLVQVPIATRAFANQRIEINGSKGRKQPQNAGGQVTLTRSKHKQAYPIGTKSRKI